MRMWFDPKKDSTVFEGTPEELFRYHELLEQRKKEANKNEHSVDRH